jgi:protein-S-isoprenylcysteine O-methyltransferase Ste14
MAIPEPPASAAESRATAPAWARALHTLATHLSQDVGGGPRPWKLATLINLQKGGTGLFVLGLMAAFGSWGSAAWTYLALHGTYGLCWLLKHAAFPDARWNARATWAGGLLTWLAVLGPYWIAPVLVVTPLLGPRPEPAPWLLALAIAMHTVGLTLMLAADAQKHAALARGPGLISDGLFSRIRHPNYLGEMLLYAAYALLARHWLPWLVLAWVWGLVFLPNILLIEASLSRHPGWAAYKARTGFLLPSLRRRGTTLAEDAEVRRGLR